MAPCTQPLLARLALMVALCLCLSNSSYGQEICNNGRDDDGDSLVDLRDSLDCPCGSARSAFVPSLVPNPSLEVRTECPDGPGEMERAQSWIQATAGTSDYLNTCGFVFEARNAGLVPFPNGEAAVGAYVAGDYKEYVGVCLPQPLVAGRRYRFTFSIAASVVSPSPDSQRTCPRRIDGIFPTIDLTLFGAPTCAGLPVQTLVCPLNDDPRWRVLGVQPYDPVQRWGQITIDFTPTQTMRAIMVGAPCQMPEGYPLSTLLTACIPYFYYDTFTLNEERFFQDRLVVSADSCAQPPVLTGQINYSVSANAQKQWYREGAAVAGATAQTFTLPSTAARAAYQFQVVDSGRCLVSAPLSIASTPRTVHVSNLADTLFVAGSVVQLTDSTPDGDSRLWTLCDGSTNTGKSVALTLTDTGRCCVTLAVTRSGCTDTVRRCFEVIPRPKVFIPNIFTPNGDGINKVFTVTSRGLKAMDGKVYNRWGNQMYAWQGLEGRWDGTVSGQQAGEGTYYYIITYKDAENRSHTAKGFVDLVR